MPLVIKEMQIRQGHITTHPLKWLKLKRPSTGKNVEQLELSYTAGENGKWHKYLENSLAVSLKSLTFTTIDPATLPLGIFPLEMKGYVHRKTCTLMFIVALFVTAKNWKRTKFPSTGK